VNTVQTDHELYAFRRHLRACRFFGPGGREVRADKCNCPFQVDGLRNGQRVRGSLKTRSRQLADRRLAELKRKLDGPLANQPAMHNEAEPEPVPAPTTLTLAEAVARFLKTHGEIGPDGKYRGDSQRGTWKKYRCALRLLAAYCEKAEIQALADVTTDALEDFRGTRNIGKVTWKVERQMLITFFRFCARRQWISRNPARELKAPRNLKPNEVVPYTLAEESQILAACEQIGGGKYRRSGARYEQLRARAMILLLRHTALRVSDICTLRKDAVSWDAEKHTWRVFLYTKKRAIQCSCRFRRA
jgi:integrase